jgi:hypothetical protein
MAVRAAILSCQYWWISSVPILMVNFDENTPK